jgi:hypothetical protein
MQAQRRHRFVVLTTIMLVIALVVTLAFFVLNSSKPTTSNLFPGEIDAYQGQNLTPVNAYIEYLNQHPDVAIKGVQNIDPATYKLAISGMVTIPPITPMIKLSITLIRRYKLQLFPV